MSVLGGRFCVEGWLLGHRTWEDPLFLVMPKFLGVEKTPIN